MNFLLLEKTNFFVVIETESINNSKFIAQSEKIKEKLTKFSSGFGQKD